MSTNRHPELLPYRVEPQADGRFAVVTPNLGAVPEMTYPTEGEAVSRARACLRYDNE